MESNNGAYQVFLKIWPQVHAEYTCQDLKYDIKIEYLSSIAYRLHLEGIM